MTGNDMRALYLTPLLILAACAGGGDSPPLSKVFFRLPVTGGNWLLP